MTLMLPVLREPLVFRENQIQCLIIENPLVMREMMADLTDLAAGRAGKSVLSESFAPIDFINNAVLITDPFRLEFESKKLLGKLISEVSAVAVQHGDRLMRLISEINQLASDLCIELDFDAAFNGLERPEELVRMMGFYAEGEHLPFAERLLAWMRLQRRFLGKQLFIIYGLSAFLEENELSALYRNVFYEKLNLLLIEPRQFRPPLCEESVTIIDRDICIIS